MTESSNDAISPPPRNPNRTSFPAAPECVEVKQINALLLCNGWAPRDVDSRAGWNEGTFAQARTRNFPEGTHARVERVFGVRIWCDERTWLLRDACFRRYQFDPALLNKGELRAWLKKLSLTHRVPANPTCEQLVSALLNHMAANPTR